ncbi:glycosyltransferase family 39 protein [Patescibacteria group bacterium]|nr:glycosyltransferase family 39 protein [Patescibacteria group bacterium]
MLIQKAVVFIEKNWAQIILVEIITAALVLRVVNLNYNSPFNDEAIYTVIGRLGLFQGDWWTYNAAAWMAGQPYIYPPMSAIAYLTGGIVGSRLLNVVFGVLTIEVIFALTKELVAYRDEGQANIAGLIGATVAGVATVGLYVSRLATYDMPSFYFLVLSLLFIHKAEEKETNYGLWYFLGFIFLAMALLTKIVIGLYIPFLFIYTFWQARKLKQQFKFWVRYFAVPLVLVMLYYIGINLHNLLLYEASQAVRGKNSWEVIWEVFWINTRYVWALWLIASVPLLTKINWKKWFIYSFLSLVVIIFHFVTQREPTLDKHTYLTVLFLSPLIGGGLAHLLDLRGAVLASRLLAVNLIAILLIFTFVSYEEIYRFNNLWRNSNSVLSFLSTHVRPGDKVLSEVGASAILATYDNNFPTYTVTFDWFQYRNLTGQKAYLAAINDGYFDWIELDGGDETLEQIHSTMHNVVLENLAGNYTPIYNRDGYLVYKRSY